MTTVPKQIWLWWEQGWENAPRITRLTIESYKHFNPDYSINLVSRQNLNNYIDKEYNWLFNCEGPAFRADIIRLLLLQKYGGIYSDAATFCCVSLDKFIEDIRFDRFWSFNVAEFSKQQNEERSLSSWFYISQPNCDIINIFTKSFIENAKKNPRNHPYYLHHITLKKLIHSDPIFSDWYDNMTKISVFHNRLDARILGNNVTSILNQPEWFHVRNVKKEIDDKSFFIIKLRHKELPLLEQLTKQNSVLSYLVSKMLSKDCKDILR